ncbi:hypothetical protein EHW64_14660 [Erwinia psidii]|uniref:hypothetical protein n=1 Tax=Erwinia psidii TaxID=69224 RepID=UPI00226BA4D4|nr:hypothetical protein [Erwinia psidii]MCX8962339.1 hypothetical protein [Erwinia psidii]
MPTVNSTTNQPSVSKTTATSDISTPQEHDIWFDAIDLLEMNETWFDASDRDHADLASAEAAADFRVPFTEDCRRGVQQLIRTLGEYEESKMLSACVSKILPGTPASLVMAANSLYTALTEKRNIDAAALHALGIASWCLPDNMNIVSQLAAFIRDTVTGWTDGTCLQQFLNSEENHFPAHLYTALAVTAIVAGRWMKDEGAPKRGVLKVPAFMANLFIRASHYWNALGDMARNDTSSSRVSSGITQSPQRVPAFEVDTSIKMTGYVCDASVDCLSSSPSITAFSSNSTTNPEAYTQAMVHNKPPSAPDKAERLSVAEQAHSLAMEKLRQESGLTDLLYCATHKTETRQQTNEKVITDTYFNTKCDGIAYPEPLRKTAENTVVRKNEPETEIIPPVTNDGGDKPLLPVTGMAVALPVAASQMRPGWVKYVPVTVTGLTGVLMLGKSLWWAYNRLAWNDREKNDPGLLKTNSTHKQDGVQAASMLGGNHREKSDPGLLKTTSSNEQDGVQAASFGVNHREKSDPGLLKTTSSYKQDGVQAASVLDGNLKSNPYIKQSLEEKNAKKKKKELISPEKAYTQEGVREKILDAMHDYSAVFTDEKTINYLQMDADINKKGIKSDGTVDSDYFLDKKSFFQLVENKILGIKDDEKQNESAKFVRLLLKKILSRKGIMKKINGVSYVKTPKALTMLFTSMLGNLRVFDHDAFYEDFSKEDVQKFTGLKIMQRNLDNYMQKKIRGKNFKQIKKIKDRKYHIDKLNMNFKYKFMNYLLLPYLDKKSDCYEIIKKDVSENIKAYTQKDIILKVFDVVENEIKKTISLPLSYMDNDSPIGQHVNKLTQVIRKVQTVFGGLYDFDSKGNVDDSSVKAIREKIKSVYFLLGENGGNPNYRNELDKLSAINNMFKEQTEHQHEGNGFIKSDIGGEYAILLERYQEAFNSKFDDCLSNKDDKDIISTPVEIKNSNDAFMSQMQIIIKEISSKTEVVDNDFNIALGKFHRGELSKQDFNKYRHSIINLFVSEYVLPSLSDPKLRTEFSTILLSKVTGVDIQKINSVSEEGLLSSGFFYNMKKESQALYNNKITKEIEVAIDLIKSKNPGPYRKKLIDAIENGKLSLFSKSQRNSIVDSELTLAIKIVSAELDANDDVKSFTEKVITSKINELENIKKVVEGEIYKVGVSKELFDKNLQKLKDVNTQLLNMKIELRERYEAINYMDSIVSECSVVNDEYVSPYMPLQQSKYAKDNIEDVKIAAVKHLYKITESSSDKHERLKYLNLYNAIVVSGKPEAYHVQNLAAMYWSVFYNSSFKNDIHSIMKYFDNTNVDNKRLNFSGIVNSDSEKMKIKALISYISTSRIRVLFKNAHSTAVHLEQIAEGFYLPSTYFSIKDIKRRSEIPGHSFSEFSSQFTKMYTSQNMDKDVTQISGARFRKSGIDVKQLDLPPKKVYTYKHLSRPGNNYKAPPRDDDVVIVITQDNSVIISVAFDNKSAVRYIPPVDHEPKLGEIDAIVKDLAPYSLEYYDKRHKDIDKEVTDSIIKSVNLFYSKEDEFTYSFVDNNPNTNYLVMDCDSLSISDNEVSTDIYSWGKRELLVLEKTSPDENGSVESILHRQIKNTLYEKIEMMKVVYNDAEDVLGEILTYAPIPFISFALVARKIINGMPVTKSDVAAMVIDTVTNIDLPIKVTSLIKTALIDNVDNEIKSLVLHDADLAVAESQIKDAVRIGISKSIADEPLTSMIKSDKIIIPKPAELERSFNNYQMDSTGNFVSSSCDSLDATLHNLEGKIDEGISMSDGIYYNKLRERVGKKNLELIGIDFKNIWPRSMIFQADIDAVINDVEQAGQNAVVQYNNAYHAYQQKVADSYVRFIPDGHTPQEVYADFIADGYAMYGYGNIGVENLRHIDGALHRNANFIIQSFVSTDTLVSKSNHIFQEAFRLDGGGLLRNQLRDDVRRMWAELTEQQVDDILASLSSRSYHVNHMTAMTVNNNFSNVCFFGAEAGGEVDAGHLLVGKVYPTDAGKTVFMNVAAPNLAPHRTVMHEMSHFVGTLDYIYLSDSFIGTMTPISQKLGEWKNVNSVVEMIQVVPDYEIRTFFDMRQDEFVGQPHYQAAFEISRSPNFVTDFIKNNADSYVEFIEYMDKKYTVNEDGAVIINPAYRNIRSASSSEDDKVINMRKILLKMLFSQSRPQFGTVTKDGGH